MFYAASRAHREKGKCFTVYKDAHAFYVPLHQRPLSLHLPNIDALGTYPKRFPRFWLQWQQVSLSHRMPAKSQSS